MMELFAAFEDIPNLANSPVGECNFMVTFTSSFLCAQKLEINKFIAEMHLHPAYKEKSFSLFKKRFELGDKQAASVFLFISSELCRNLVKDASDFLIGCLCKDNYPMIAIYCLHQLQAGHSKFLSENCLIDIEDLPFNHAVPMLTVLPYAVIFRKFFTCDKFLAFYASSFINKEHFSRKSAIHVLDCLLPLMDNMEPLSFYIPKKEKFKEFVNLAHTVSQCTSSLLDDHKRPIQNFAACASSGDVHYSWILMLTELLADHQNDTIIRFSMQIVLSLHFENTEFIPGSPGFAYITKSFMKLMGNPMFFEKPSVGFEMVQFLAKIICLNGNSELCRTLLADNLCYTGNYLFKFYFSLLFAFNPCPMKLEFDLFYAKMREFVLSAKCTAKNFRCAFFVTAFKFSLRVLDMNSGSQYLSLVSIFSAAGAPVADLITHSDKTAKDSILDTLKVENEDLTIEQICLMQELKLDVRMDDCLADKCLELAGLNYHHCLRHFLLSKCALCPWNLVAFVLDTTLQSTLQSEDFARFSHFSLILQSVIEKISSLNPIRLQAMLSTYKTEDRTIELCAIYIITISLSREKLFTEEIVFHLYCSCLRDLSDSETSRNGKNSQFAELTMWRCLRLCWTGNDINMDMKLKILYPRLDALVDHACGLLGCSYQLVSAAVLRTLNSLPLSLGQYDASVEAATTAIIGDRHIRGSASDENMQLLEDYLTLVFKVQSFQDPQKSHIINRSAVLVIEYLKVDFRILFCRFIAGEFNRLTPEDITLVTFEHCEWICDLFVFCPIQAFDAYYDTYTAIGDLKSLTSSPILENIPDERLVFFEIKQRFADFLEKLDTSRDTCRFVECLLKLDSKVVNEVSNRRQHINSVAYLQRLRIWLYIAILLSKSDFSEKSGHNYFQVINDVLQKETTDPSLRVLIETCLSLQMDMSDFSRVSETLHHHCSSYACSFIHAVGLKMLTSGENFFVQNFDLVTRFLACWSTVAHNSIRIAAHVIIIKIYNVAKAIAISHADLDLRMLESLVEFWTSHEKFATFLAKSSASLFHYQQNAPEGFENLGVKDLFTKLTAFYKVNTYERFP